MGLLDKKNTCMGCRHFILKSHVFVGSTVGVCINEANAVKQDGTTYQPLHSSEDGCPKWQERGCLTKEKLRMPYNRGEK